MQFSPQRRNPAVPGTRGWRAAGRIGASPGMLNQLRREHGIGRSLLGAFSVTLLLSLSLRPAYGQNGTYFFLTTSELASACVAITTSPRVFPYSECDRDLERIDLLLAQRQGGERCTGEEAWRAARTVHQRLRALRDEYLAWYSEHQALRDSSLDTVIGSLAEARFGCSVSGPDYDTSEAGLRALFMDDLERKYGEKARSALIERYVDSTGRALDRDFPALETQAKDAGLDHLRALIERSDANLFTQLPSQLISTLGRSEVLRITRGELSASERRDAMANALKHVIDRALKQWHPQWYAEVIRFLRESGYLE